MEASFIHFVSLCTVDTARIGLAGGLLAGLFLAGAAGSVVHCAPMCGGFVLGQVSDRMAQLPLCEWRRLRAGLLVPYHLGRLTTYALLGAGAASSIAVLRQIPFLSWLSAALLAAAAGIFLLQALAAMGMVRSRMPPIPAAWPRLIARLTRHIDRRSVTGGYLLGLVLGLLPCGLLYGAIAAAATGGDGLRGALAMLCFGLGTVPMLMVIGVAGQTASRLWRNGWSVATPFVLIWNSAMLLGAAGLQILSPQ